MTSRLSGPVHQQWYRSKPLIHGILIEPRFITIYSTETCYCFNTTLGRNLREFGSVLRKIAKVESGDRLVFGELFFLPKIAQPCDALREFVRKAVSWSKDIPRAVVACRCETAVEIYKVKEQDYTTFHIL
ncbi:hypothetical protein COOONC_20625 [Cooperia oncophora]